MAFKQVTLQSKLSISTYKHYFHENRKDHMYLFSYPSVTREIIKNNFEISITKLANA